MAPTPEGTSNTIGAVHASLEHPTHSSHHTIAPATASSNTTAHSIYRYHPSKVADSDSHGGLPPPLPHSLFEEITPIATTAAMTRPSHEMSSVPQPQSQRHTTTPTPPRGGGMATGAITGSTIRLRPLASPVPEGWETDPQLAGLEIQRIKEKTIRIRQARGTGGTDAGGMDAYAMSDGEADRAEFLDGDEPDGELLEYDLNHQHHHSPGPSPAAKEAQAQLLRTFHTRGRTPALTSTSRGQIGSAKHSNSPSSPKSAGNSTNNNTLPNTTAESPQTPSTLTTPATTATTTNSSQSSSLSSSSSRLALHDLCGEATTPDDVAWRNALFLLASDPSLASVTDEQGWTPLHICCLSGTTPIFLLRALLYTYRQACAAPDEGGRLPLHLLAAAPTVEAQALQLVGQEYPPALVSPDGCGYIPLHLLLRNTAVELTTERLQCLLLLSGIENNTTRPSPHDRSQGGLVLQRRRQHLALSVRDLDAWRTRQRPVTYFNKYPYHDPRDTQHEQVFDTFPPDVRLAMRKLMHWRKQRHIQATPSVDEDEPIEWGAVEPAAIPEPVSNQLPIHMLVHRAVVLKQTLDVLPVAAPSRSHENRDSSDSDSDSDSNITSTSTHSTDESHRPSVPYVVETLRLIATAFPAGLVHRDANGMTPVLTALQCRHALPSLAVIELLLGKRSAGREARLPPWAQDLPLHEMLSTNYENPAAVPCTSTGQLPLHVAAEECLTDGMMLATIYDSYPAAIHVPDARGRTPLHLALQSYRRIPVDPKIIALLFSDRVAHIRDDSGKLPLDLLLENASQLPPSPPRIAVPSISSSNFDKAPEQAASVYQRFFQESMLGSARPHSSRESRAFLDRLRALPPWLRREVCAVSFVQESIVDELASPLKCSLVLFDGVTLVVLLIVFRLQLKQNIDMIVFVGDVSLPSWYTFTVYALATYRIMAQIVWWTLSASRNEFRHLFLFNPRTWIDLLAMSFTLGTSICLNMNIEEELLLQLGTCATGFLWIALVGFLSNWCYGMAVFVGSLVEIAHVLLWPLLVAGALVVAGSQMFYTLLYLDCDEAIPNTLVCSVRDSYRIVYAIARGETLVDLRGVEQLSTEVIILVGTFHLLLVVLLVALLVSVLMTAASTNMEQVAIDSFWEPKLAFILSSSDPNDNTGPRRSQVSHKAGFYAILGSFWDTLTLPWGQQWSKRDAKWYATSVRSTCLGCLFGILAIILVPAWFLLGLITLGVLWPPQIRKWLFRPVVANKRQVARKESQELTATQLSDIRRDMLQLKIMSYEKSIVVEEEIKQLREILRAAIKNE